jgi:hypothetical protein
MLPDGVRWLTYGVALAYAALGSVLYLAPDFSAARMPWRASDFLVMTVGAWFVGTGVFAWRAARDWRWRVVYPLLIYVWAFSLGQAVLLIVNSGDLRERGLSWPYLLVLWFAGLVAVVGIVAAVRARLPLREASESEQLPWPVLALVGAFVVAVGLLALPLVDGYDNPGSIWPAGLTIVGARAFAVFFAALGVSALAILFFRGLPALAAYARAGVVLNLLILVAALVYRDRFDFSEHPGQLLYVGLYAAVLVSTLGLLTYVERR